MFVEGRGSLSIAWRRNRLAPEASDLGVQIPASLSRPQLFLMLTASNDQTPTPVAHRPGSRRILAASKSQCLGNSYRVSETTRPVSNALWRASDSAFGSSLDLHRSLG